MTHSLTDPLTDRGKCLEMPLHLKGESWNLDWNWVKNRGKAKDRILIIPRRVLMEANWVRLGLAGLANEPH